MVYRPEIRDNGWRPLCYWMGMHKPRDPYCMTCPFDRQAEFEEGDTMVGCPDVPHMGGLIGYEEHLIRHTVELLDPVAKLTMSGQVAQARQNVLDAIANLEGLL